MCNFYSTTKGKKQKTNLYGNDEFIYILHQNNMNMTSLQNFQQGIINIYKSTPKNLNAQFESCSVKKGGLMHL